MKYVTKCNTNEEEIEWENFIPSKASKLIIGTFPTAPHRRCFKFFYPNKDNPFWDVLAEIADINLTPTDDANAIENRQLILTKLNLGITDMGFKVLRHNDSSLDQSIFPVEFMDILKILDDHPTIQKLIITSSSGENSVEGWLRSYCKLNGVKFPKLKGNNPKYGGFRHNSIFIKVVSVHSTSRAAAKKFDDLVEMYRKEIL
jgi:G:T/U-mismatch repair DNA glycosylase